MKSLPDAALVVVTAYLEVNAEVATRSKIILAQQAESMLRAGWSVDDLAAAARAYAAVDGPADRFALWAHRRSRSFRNWWSDR